MGGSAPEQPQAVRPLVDQPSAAPSPPPGPGVQPPFVAPPTDGTRQRRWAAAGLSAGAALLFCVVGAAGFGGLVYFGVQAVGEQAQGTVVDYLTALRDQQYGQAYDLLCDDLQAGQSVDAFAREQASRPRISDFTVGQASLVTDPVEVPATIDYIDGEPRQVRYVMFQDTSTGGFEVCGEAG